MIDIRNKFVFKGNVTILQVALKDLVANLIEVPPVGTKRKPLKVKSKTPMSKGEYIITRDMYTVVSNGEKICLYSHTLAIDGIEPYTFLMELRCTESDYDAIFYIHEGEEETGRKKAIDCFDETLFERIEDLENTIEV